MKKILVIGSLNMDLVTHVGRTPKVGETVSGSEIERLAGGKGANQAVAIARLGGDVALYGMVGMDENGEYLFQSLQSNDVDCSLIRKGSQVDTGKAFIMVNRNGDNSIVLIPGANKTFDCEQLDESIFENFDILVVQLEIPLDTVRKALKLAKKHGMYTIVNPAPAKELDEKMLKNIDLIIPNETEFEEITGVNSTEENDLIDGAKQLIRKGVGQVVVTLGSRGALYVGPEVVKRFQGHLVDVLDTTAAGDSVIGAIASGLACAMPIEQSIEMAMLVGALTVSKSGAQDSIPTINEVERFKKEHRHDKN